MSLKKCNGLLNLLITNWFINGNYSEIAKMSFLIQLDCSNVLPKRILEILEIFMCMDSNEEFEIPKDEMNELISEIQVSLTKK